MRQYIRSFMNEEQKLLRYNIMEIGFQDGYLKPKEPMVEKEQSVNSTEPQYLPDCLDEEVKTMPRWWLTMEDYSKSGGLLGASPFLEQHTKGANYIQNTSGERLVYMGNSTGWFLNSRFWK
eukprot:CAMPEP_0203846446 /NCGR_PEP_ID=MMETSP0359-20131031/4433_1 /ASSEMBLY_ACC=CAM_ASM_000338 /TAXON_ID=268821 /ORGANISM="Scrippsiella Hangoei, Strain SHTV-5" /LENGTH=120 /DNA_ID=CAMNT_0050761771 /DNA_START=12 /DNA_END=371 /DNA_ORIENTATION=-